MSLSINRNIAAASNDFFALSPVKTAPTASRATVALADGAVVADPTPSQPAERSDPGLLGKLSVFGQLKNFIGGKIADGFSSIGSFLKNAASTAGQVGRFIGNKLVDGFSSIGSFLKDAASTVGQVGRFIGGKIADGFSSIGGFFKKVGGGFVNFFKNPLDHLKSFGAGIKALGGKIMDAGLWAGGKLGDGFMSFMKGGAWVAGKMREGVVAAADAIGSAAKKVGGFIKSLF